MKKIINQIRAFSWLIQGFISKYYQFALLSFLLGGFSLFIYFRFHHLLPKIMPVQKIGLVGRFTTADLPLTIRKKISRGLTKIGPDGAALPDLALNWEIKDDGKTYFFFLKEGLRWQDETPFLAQDIAYNFKNVLLEPFDEKTLQVKLEEPFVPLPTLFSQPLLKENYLGLGDYQVTNLKMAGHYLQSISLTDLKNKQTILYRFYPTPEAALLGFKLGEIDTLEELNKPQLLDWPNINQSSAINFEQVVAIYFSLEDAYLSSKSLRQALAYSLENKKNDGERALGPLNPHSWAYNSQVKPYSFDMEAAQTLFEKFKKEVNLEEDFSLELTTTLSQLDVAEEIKKSWEKLNIQTQIKVVSERPAKFQAFLASRQIPADPDQYSLWHSTQEANLTRFKSPKIDKLLEDGRQEQDLEKRKEIYFDFQRFLVEDSPAIFLFHPRVFTIQRQSLPYF